MLSADVDLMQLCRLCLVKDGGKVPILADDNPERIVKINTCLPVNVSRDDCLPKTICNGCSIRLDLHYQFWTMALNTQNELMMLWNQINLKPDVDITEEAIVQIKNESFEIKEEVIEAHEQTAVDLEDVTINTETSIEEISLKLKSEAEMFPKQSENDYDVDSVKVNLNVLFSHTTLQNPSSISSSFQLKKCNKRWAAIDAAKIVRNVAEDNEDMSNSDVDEDFIIPTNNDMESEDDPIENLDFVPVGVTKNTEATSVCSNTGVEIKTMESDKVLKSKLICPNSQSLVGQKTKEELKFKLRACELLTQKSIWKQAFKCTICENKFGSFADLNEHTCKHIDHTRYKCDICEYKCANLSHLERHRWIHTDGKPYKCNICKYKSPYSSALQLHMRTHTGEKPYKCNICEYKCSCSGTLQRHMRKHTGEKPYKCNICQYNCSELNVLRRHMRRHSGEKPYKCSICDFKCSQSSNLQYHMRRHTGEKPYKCNVCEFKCSQPSNLQYHMRTHTGEKPYKCNTCDYACSQSCNFRRHLLKHTGEKLYKCNVCEYKCSELSVLWQHMHTHGEKPYKCNICEFKCSESSNLKHHMLKHTGDERFQCHDRCQSNNVTRLIRMLHSYSKLT